MGKTIAKKIFATHLVDEPAPGVNVIRLDAVFCHEITTPVALPPEITAPKPSDLNVEIWGGCTENVQNCTEKSTGCTEVAPKIAPESDDKMRNHFKP